MSSENPKRTIELDQQPESGMILIGFSCPAELEGRELKREIIDLLQIKKKLGLREAVRIVKEKALASFDDAKAIVEEIFRDLRSSGEAAVYKKVYKYSVSRMFWGFEQDMPKNDPRYFKLKIVDMQSLDMDDYRKDDGSLDSARLMRELMTEEDRARPGLLNRLIESKIEDPEQDPTLVDAEWNDRKV